MLIIALVLAVIGLAALVFAVVTSNELVAWVCIAASVVGVVLLIIDALQERRRRDTATPADTRAAPDSAAEEAPADYDYADYPQEAAAEEAESADQTGAEPVTARSDDEKSAE